jgi:hypothetical protein
MLASKVTLQPVVLRVTCSLAAQLCVSGGPLTLWVCQACPWCWGLSVLVTHLSPSAPPVPLWPPQHLVATQAWTEGVMAAMLVPALLTSGALPTWKSQLAVQCSRVGP